MSKRKKIIVLSCMIALLAVTAVFNFVLTNKEVTTEDAVSTAGYFVQYKTERATSRNEQILQLNEIIGNKSASQEAISQAIDYKLKLTKAMENELRLEYLMKTNGYENVAVTIGTTTDNISVIVQDADLTQDDAIKIYSIVLDNVNVSPENVNIIPIS